MRHLAAIVVAASLALLALGACARSEEERSDEARAPTATSTLTATSSPVATASAVASGEWWRPAVGVTWQWQLQGDPNTAYNVEVYDLDLFDTPAETIASLQGEGRRVVCYFSAGSAEDWRPDFGDFPAEAIGKPLDGWEGERWVDIRSPTVRAVLVARLDLAAAKGCDGVEPDNVQGYDDDTGFDFDYADQIDFNRMLATEAHARGLAIGLKNGGSQVEDLIDAFDFVLNEECHAYDECEDYAPFIAAGKPVLNAEYRDSLDDAEAAVAEVCPAAESAGLSTLILPLDLDDSFRVACADPGG